MIIPGMVSATFREKTADDIIRLCKEADLQAVEWSENAHVMPGDPEGAAELLKKDPDGRSDRGGLWFILPFGTK